MMRLETRAQTANRVVRSRCHMAKRAPVIRHHRSSAQALEELERVFMCEMPFAETRFPPRRVSDRQQSEIELAPVLPQRVFDETMCIRNERRVAGEEHGLARIEEIHVRRATPPIDAVSIATVSCSSGVQIHVTNLRHVSGGEIHGIAVAEASQPARDDRWSKQR